MTDRITANLPARDMAQTSTFYQALGFTERFRDNDWMILGRGGLEVEFFAHPTLDPAQSWFSACLRVDDLKATYAAFQLAGLSTNPREIPRLTPVETVDNGLRLFALVDCNGSLLRCIANQGA